MADFQIHIQRIGQKLQLLLKQQEQLLRENERLKTQLELRDAELKETRDAAASLEEQVAILKTAAGNMDERSKKDFEKRINQYLKDIDKVIAHLNT